MKRFFFKEDSQKIKDDKVKQVDIADGKKKFK